MQIEYIRLKNFRGFKDVTLRDLPRFCVLVGANGSGKPWHFLDFSRGEGDAVTIKWDLAEKGHWRVLREADRRNKKRTLDLRRQAEGMSQKRRVESR